MGDVKRFSSPRNGDSPSSSAKSTKKRGLRDASNPMDHMSNIYPNMDPSLVGARSKQNWLASKSVFVQICCKKNKKDLFTKKKKKKKKKKKPLFPKQKKKKKKKKKS